MPAPARWPASATLACSTTGPVVTDGLARPRRRTDRDGARLDRTGVDLDLPAGQRGIGDQHHDGSRGHVVGMGASERQRRIGEASGEGDGVFRIRGELRQVGGVEPHAEASRDDGARALVGPSAFHRPLHPALELHRLDAGAEQRGARALEEPLEEPLDVGKGGHGDGNRTRGRRRDPDADRDRR